MNVSESGLWSCSVWVGDFCLQLSSSLTHFSGITLSSDVELFRMSEHVLQEFTVLFIVVLNIESCSGSFCDLTVTILTNHRETSTHCTYMSVSDWALSREENNKTSLISIGSCKLLLTLSLFLYLSHFFTIFSHFSALSTSSCFLCEWDRSCLPWHPATGPFVTIVSAPTSPPIGQRHILEQWGSALWILAQEQWHLFLYLFFMCCRSWQLVLTAK